MSREKLPTILYNGMGAKMSDKKRETSDEINKRNRELLEKTGGPAFPQGIDEGTSAAGFPIVEHKGGLTIRDYFAGQAMVGELSSQSEHIGEYENNKKSADLLAYRSFMFADAMIEARDK